jgi:3-hydroxy acid dehydrogenase/malonic semialdehyde reductase
MPKGFDQQTVLITGASGGIGEACAYAFASAGANLIITGRNEDSLQKVSSKARKISEANCEILCFDITDRQATEKSLREIKNDIDILINNAGLASGLDKIQDGQIDDWETMIDTNIKGVLYATRLILPSMVKKNSGHIFNLSSTAAHQVYPGGAVYCGTKHFVDCLTRGLKQELHGTNIRVTSISPGAVKTNFSNIRFKGDTKRADAVYDKMRHLTADDIAEIVIFCASRPSHVNINDIIISATDQFLAL